MISAFEDKLFWPIVWAAIALTALVELMMAAATIHVLWITFFA